MRLSALTKKFLAFCDATKKPATKEYYLCQLGKFLKRAGDKPIDRYKPVHLSMNARTWHEVQAVQRLFQFAVDELEVLKRNPFSKVDRPPAGQRTRIMSPRELTLYFWRAQKPFRRFLIAMRESLARPQEIRALQWEQLAADQGWHGELDQALAAGRAMFILRDYKARDRRNDPTAPRLILVNRRFGRLLLRMRRSGSTGHVFLNGRGRPWTRNAIRCCNRRLRKKMKIAPIHGENVVTYTIRHSIATLASGPGKIRDRLLAELLGHTDVETTARYQHLQIEHLRVAMDAIENLRIEAIRLRLKAKKPPRRRRRAA